MGGSQELATEAIEPEETGGPQLAVCLVSGGMDSCTSHTDNAPSSASARLSKPSPTITA